MRVAYMFRGQLWYANKAPTETPLFAVCRALKRRLNADVTLWPHADASEGNETWRAQWFDSKTYTYQESFVRI